MELYGDESGHLRSLLEGDEDLFVLAVVAGEREQCMKCPKRTVRTVTDIAEAKWNGLTDTQRRRLVDCLTECEPNLSFGYVAIKQSDLHRLENHYRLYEDDLQYEWDLCIIGDCYATLVGEFLQNRDGHKFTFDRLFSKKMSNRIVEVMRERELGIEIHHDNSRKTTGIQTADCLAGAVREDILENCDWIEKFDEVNCATESALNTVQQRLKTGP